MHNKQYQAGTLSVFILMLIISTASWASPLIHEQYNSDQIDLERYWILGYLDRATPATYPFSNRDIVRRLRLADDNNSLQGYDKYLSRLYRLESDTTIDVTSDPTRSYRFFNMILRNLGGFTNDIFRRNLDLYQVNDPENEVNYGVNTVQRAELIYDETFKDDMFLLYGWGMESWLTWKGRFGGYVRFTDTVERMAGNHTEVYNDYAGYIAPSSDYSSISYDETVAYLAYQGDSFRARFGRGKHAWGPGFFQRLMFGESYQSYPYIELEFNWRDKLYLSYFHGQLDAGDEVPDDTLYVSAEGNVRTAGNERYVAAHRLEIMPTSNFALGLTEAVVYGERNPELGYLLPLNIYWSEGHNQDYDDNVMWSIDMRLRAMRGLLLYGEFFIDEMNLGALFSSEFGNRTGYVVGSRWITPLGIKRTEIRVEYMKLRPFVYTHWHDINLPSNYGEKLGSQLEPNSDELNVQLRWYPWNSFTFDIFSQLYRHGATPEGEEVVGGSYLESRLGNENRYPFLAGIREDRVKFGGTITWRALEQFKLFMTAAIGEYNDKDYKMIVSGVHYRF